ncbi:MAG: hypothetical protein JW716_05975 [Candidatus Aenigmarchaeota archaeon]|nr:hypothetical protein [Candidatus Aenigmarchaeota archaeon]
MDRNEIKNMLRKSYLSQRNVYLTVEEKNGRHSHYAGKVSSSGDSEIVSLHSATPKGQDILVYHGFRDGVVSAYLSPRYKDPIHKGCVIDTHYESIPLKKILGKKRTVCYKTVFGNIGFIDGTIAGVHCNPKNPSVEIATDGRILCMRKVKTGNIFSIS